jgi:hypothetical protein
MKPNIDITALDTLQIHELAQLPVGVLADLQEEVDNALALARKRRAVLDLALDYKYGSDAQKLRLSEGKDTGIVRLDDGEFVVTSGSNKTVFWDQNGLDNLAGEINQGGKDPAVYIVTERKLTVRENAYKSWPIHIQKSFEQYRTVKIGKPTYRIDIKAISDRKVA